MSKRLLKIDLIQNACEKIAENLDFVENSNFITERTEAAARRCSDINSQVKYLWWSPIIVKMEDLSQ